MCMLASGGNIFQVKRDFQGNHIYFFFACRYPFLSGKQQNVRTKELHQLQTMLHLTAFLLAINTSNPALCTPQVQFKVTRGHQGTSYCLSLQMWLAILKKNILKGSNNKYKQPQGLCTR